APAGGGGGWAAGGCAGGGGGRPPLSGGAGGGPGGGRGGRAGAARAVGGARARLHPAPPFPERRESRYRFSNIMARFQSVKGLLPADEADDLALALEALAGRAPLPTGIIHGDLFPDNVLFEGDRLVAPLDFEQASDGAFA